MTYTSEQTRADIQGILLAAGRGSRFGADKLLYPLPDGTPIALQSARNMRAALPQVLVVIRPDAADLAALLRREGFTALVASEADLGMGHSVAAGVAASAHAPGWLIGLADMPYVLPQTSAQIALAIAGGAPLAAPQYQGRRGHPVGWGAAFREALLALKGDAGARTILAAETDRLRLIPVDDPGVLYDIDTPQDLLGKATRQRGEGPQP